MNDSENEDHDRVTAGMPRPVEVPDLAFSEAVEFLGVAAAAHCRLVAGCDDEDMADKIGAFGESVRAGASAGLLDPTVTLDALMTIIEVICMKGKEPLAHFFEESTAKGAEMLRSEGSTRTIWRSDVEYRDFRDDLDALDDLEQAEVQQIVLTVDMVHRLGAMAANLEKRLYGAGTHGESDLIEKWTVSAAVSAFMHGTDEDDTSSDVGALAALPIVLMVEVLTWLDTKVLPGLSHAVIEFICNELVPQMVLHAAAIAGPPAGTALGEAA